MSNDNQAFLFDAFNLYYNKGVEAKESGNIKFAKSQFLLASETLLKLAKNSKGDLKKARFDRATRLLDYSESLQENQPAEKVSGSVKQRTDSSDETATKWVEESIPGIRFVDVAGLDDVKASVNERIILPMKYKEIYKKFKRKAGGGILMYGLPGTGKTLIAKAIAGEVGAKFYSVKCSDIMSKWFGEAEKNVRNLFTEAKKNEASVIFFDEFESIGSERDASNPVMARLIPELLSQMNGFNESENVLLFIAATNRPWDIDSAFLRPGRFNELQYIPLPDFAARLYLLNKTYKDLPMAEDIDLNEIATLTEGFNGADIVEFCEQSKTRPIMRAIQNGENQYEQITKEDIDFAVKKVHSSVREKDIKLLEDFRNDISDNL